MGAVLSEVLPAAVGLVIVNPLPILAVVILLLSPRGARSAALFVLGWIIGLIAILSLLINLAPAAGLADDRPPSLLATIVYLVLGGLLLALAGRKWRGRPRSAATATMPGWMAMLERASPAVAFGLGVVLASLNPKNLAFTVATSLVLVQSELATPGVMVMVALFVLIAAAGVALPVAWFLVAPEQAGATLREWRAWLTTNYAVMMTVILLLFGVKLVARGLGGLID